MPNNACGAPAADNDGKAARETIDAAKRELRRAKRALDRIARDRDCADTERADAMSRSRRIANAIGQLENAQIAALLDKVAANSAQLTNATDDLRDALSQIGEVTDLIKAIDTLLQAFAVILP